MVSQGIQCGIRYLEILKWAKEDGCPLTVGACSAAESSGQLEVLKWLLSLDSFHLYSGSTVRTL